MFKRTIIRILMFNRTIFTDVVQGIIIGGVLGFLTFWILTNAYVTKANGWTTILGCGEPGNGILFKAACYKTFVPDFSGRYYSVQFTDPSDGTDFAYVGTRATGTQAGDYLITGPGWTGQVPGGMTQIALPNNSVLVIGRVLVHSDSDVAAAYDLAKLIQLASSSSN